MDINKILNADILDIIFDGKNKEYGAYDLRKTYNSRLVKALLVTGALLLLIFLATLFASAFTKPTTAKLDLLDTKMAEIAKDVPPPPPPPPPPPKAPPPPDIKQIKFTPPVIKKDEEVKPEDQPEEIKEEVISNRNVETENTKQIVQAPVEEKSQVIETPVESDQPFTKVEVEAAFPGGDGAWRKYVERNVNAQVAAENGAPEGRYTAIVQFIVSRDGSISDVICATDPGFGTCDEVIRAIKRGPKWTPAQQNGRSVNAYRKQPVTFVVEDQ